MQQAKLQAKRTAKHAKRKAKKKIADKVRVDEIRAISKLRGKGFFRMSRRIARQLYQNSGKSGISRPEKQGRSPVVADRLQSRKKNTNIGRGDR